MKRYQIHKLEETEGGFRPIRTRNKYLVVNVDEPYAEEVFNMIKTHEKEKRTWDGPDSFKEFVKLL